MKITINFTEKAFVTKVICVQLTECVFLWSVFHNLYPWYWWANANRERIEIVVKLMWHRWNESWIVANDSGFISKAQNGSITFDKLQMNWLCSYMHESTDQKQMNVSVYFFIIYSFCLCFSCSEWQLFVVVGWRKFEFLESALGAHQIIAKPEMFYLL